MHDDIRTDPRHQQVTAALQDAANTIEWLDGIFLPAGTPDPEYTAWFGGTACACCFYRMAKDYGRNVNTIKGALRALGIRYVRQAPHWLDTAHTRQCTCRWGLVR